MQNPPLYLHITSTSKEGLEAAVAEIDEMMKQDLPNLIDERRFRRREPEKVERDEFGRVSQHRAVNVAPLTIRSASGQKRRSILILNQ